MEIDWGTIWKNEKKNPWEQWAPGAQAIHVKQQWANRHTTKNSKTNWNPKSNDERAENESHETHSECQLLRRCSDCTDFEGEIMCTNGAQFAGAQVQNVEDKQDTNVGKNMQ